MLASKFVLALVFSVMICNSVCDEDRYDAVIKYCQESLQKYQSDGYKIESYKDRLHDAEKELTELTKTSEEVSGKKVKLEQVVKEIEEAMSKITTAAGV
ncbi:unnamed protein product [Calicophoron daubneyi]|uniref:Uncharacterized protein n=1 Tax=Calicophoron daubneyi TaxID=300641 RepID=A0AAV2THQ5_CALDB